MTQELVLKEVNIVMFYYSSMNIYFIKLYINIFSCRKAEGQSILGPFNKFFSSHCNSIPGTIMVLQQELKSVSENIKC